MNILLFNSHGDFENSGGTERVLCAMASEFVNRGHKVYLVHNDVHQIKPFFHLDKKVNLINLNGSGKKISAPIYKVVLRELFRSFKNINILKNFLPNPVYRHQKKYLSNKIRDIVYSYNIDVIITTFTRCMEIVNYSNNYDIPKILMFHFNPADKDFFNYTSSLNRKIIEKSDYLQVLLPKFADYLRGFYPNKNIVVIPNFVPQFRDEDIAPLQEEKHQYRIINIARIDRFKRQDLLIRAFSLLCKKYKNWCLDIYGMEYDGELVTELHNLVKKEKIEHLVSIKKPVKDVFKCLKESDIFVFPSSGFEGWGLALTEAMSVGLPCVAMRSAYASNYLIEDGVNGFLSDDLVDDLVKKIELLIKDKQLRIKIGKKAHEDMKNYAPEIIWDMWEEFLLKVANKNN